MKSAMKSAKIMTRCATASREEGLHPVCYNASLLNRIIIRKKYTKKTMTVTLFISEGCPVSFFSLAACLSRTQ